MKISKFEGMMQTTASSLSLYERLVEEAKKSGDSVSILCEERRRLHPNRGNRATERPGIVLVDGQVRKEIRICAYAEHEQGGKDYCWSSELYSDGIKTARMFYNKPYYLCASLRDSSKQRSYYSIKYYGNSFRKNDSLIYAATRRLEDSVSSDEPLGQTYHQGVKLELVGGLGMAGFDLDFVPPELIDMLAKIKKDKKPFEKESAPYLALYEYLLGEQAQKYL